MKNYLFILLFLSSCISNDQKCYKEHKDLAKQANLEIIDMGGVSVFLMEDMSKDDFRFHKIDTKEPKTRYSHYYYKSFNLNMKLYSNVDTHNDRISVFHNEELIYQTEFGEFKEINIDFNLKDEEYSQIKFVIDNSGTLNNTPGAFSATIKIKRL